MENNIEKLIEDKIQELLDKGHKVIVQKEEDLRNREITSYSLEKIYLWVSTVKNYMAGIGLTIDGNKLLDLRKEFLKQIHSKLITAKEEQQKYSEKKAREKVMKYLKVLISTALIVISYSCDPSRGIKRDFIIMKTDDKN